MTRRRLSGTAVALTLIAAPAVGYTLSCVFPADQAQLVAPDEPEFDGVSVTLRAGYQHVMLEVVHADGSDGYVALTYAPEVSQ